VPLYPFPNPNPSGWSGIQPVTAEQITQINANAAAAADGSRWTDYAHLMNWRFGAISPIDIFSNGATQYVPGENRTQNFLHWVPGPDCWLRGSDYLGVTSLSLSRDKGFHFRTLPAPSLDRTPWLPASKESTGEVAVICNASGSGDNYKLLSFTLVPPLLTEGTIADEIGVDYSTIDMGFSPGAFTGTSPRCFLWAPEQQWWMLGFVGSSGGIKTSTDLATWTNRAVGVMDGSHGAVGLVGNGEGIYLTTNTATDAEYTRSDDGGETWAAQDLPFIKGDDSRVTYVPDLGLFVFFTNNAANLIYTSPTGAEGDWTVTPTNLRVKDAQAAGRVIVAIADPADANTDQQLVASLDAGASFFRLGLDMNEVNSVRFNGKQAAVQFGEIPGNGTDSPFICSDCSG
jgi:hypothetical protein